MYNLSKKRKIKNLDKEIKRIESKIDGYNSSLSRLKEERNRIRDISNLSIEESKIQYDLIDKRIILLNRSIKVNNCVLNDLLSKYNSLK